MTGCENFQASVSLSLHLCIVRLCGTMRRDVAHCGGTGMRREPTATLTFSRLHSSSPPPPPPGCGCVVEGMEWMEVGNCIRSRAGGKGGSGREVR